MKILLVVHSFLPDAFAGVEIHVYHLARLLGERHDVHVLYRAGDPDAQEYSLTWGEYNGVSTIRLVNNHTTRDPWDLDCVPGVTDAFMEVFDRLEPDVVHVHHLGHLSADIVDRVKERNVPVVCTLHDYWHLCSRIQLYSPNWGACKGPGLFRCADCARVDDGLVRSMSRFSFVGEKLARIWLSLCRHIDWSMPLKLLARRFDRMRQLLRTYDMIIANSHHMKKRTAQFGAPAHKIMVMRYGLKTRKLRACRHEPSAEVRFGYMGSMVEHKGVAVMIEAFRRVPEASLQVWGDPDHNAEVRAYCDSLNIPDNVQFMGGFAYDEIQRVLSGMDVLIVPSIWEEAYGLTVDEAKLAGIPVIASKMGGIPEHLEHGQEGYLYRSGDAVELARHIRKLAGRPDRVKKLQPSGDDVASLEQNAIQVEHVYLALLRIRQRELEGVE